MLARAARGDREAFAELYDAFAGRLFAQVLLPRLGNAAAAEEEALAETFRSALEALGKYSDQGNGLWPWLSRIAVNKVTDMHRERARTGRALASFEALLAPLAGEVGPDADERLDQRKLAARVEEVLGRILPRYRRAIELRVLLEKERADCAREMSVTVGNFDVLVLRALRAFRAAWLEAR